MRVEFIVIGAVMFLVEILSIFAFMVNWTLELIQLIAVVGVVGGFNAIALVLIIKGIITD